MATFEMSPTIHRWVDKQVRLNMWRMPKWMEEEDLRQEGMVYWVVINNRYNRPTEIYPQGVTNIKHMMSLFMVSFKHRLHDLAANIKNPRGECHLEDIGLNILEAIAAGPGIENTILEAPEPVQSILRLLTEEGRRNLGAYARIYLGNRRDTTNLRLYRALRRQGFAVAPGQDFLGMARRYLAKEREALYEPTVIEMVGAMVEDYIQKPKRTILKLPVNVDEQTPQYNSSTRRMKRVTLTPTIEVVYVKRTHNYQAPGVRRRASHTKSRIQVPQRAWSPLRPGVHRGWPTGNQAGGFKRGYGSGLQRPQRDNERVRRERLGPRHVGVGNGHPIDNSAGRIGDAQCHNPCQGREGVGTAQNRAATLRPNGGEPG
jgi:hypothetical protein